MQIYIHAEVLMPIMWAFSHTLTGMHAHTHTQRCTQSQAYVGHTVVLRWCACHRSRQSGQMCGSQLHQECQR